MNVSDYFWVFLNFIIIIIIIVIIVVVVVVVVVGVFESARSRSFVHGVSVPIAVVSLAVADLIQRI